MSSATSHEQERDAERAGSTGPDGARTLASSATAGRTDASVTGRLDTADPAQRSAAKRTTAGVVRTLIVTLVILLAVGAAIWKIRQNKQQTAAEGQQMAAAADRPIPVQTNAVAMRNMPVYLTELGTVTAYNTVTIKTRVDGQLIQVNFREGQSVRKGQLLLEIDPRPYQAALAQAQGQLTKDQANSVNAQAEAARYTALYQAGVVSKESQQSQISTAGQASGSIQADQAAIEAAKVNLAYTRITSPIDGVVGLRQVDPGNIVHAADTTGLVVVTQIHPISVIFTLPEDQLPQVLQRTRSGQKLVVEAYDRSDSTHLASGSLLTVDNEIDTTTGTDKVKAVFDNKEGTLFPNQFVNVRLVLQERPNAIVVPAAAIQTGTQGSFVYVVRPGDPPGYTPPPAPERAPAREGKGARAGGAERAHFFVEAQPVKIALTEGAQVILDGGVRPGDQIVVDGQEKLKNGARVIPHAGPLGGSGGANGASGAGTIGANGMTSSTSDQTPAATAQQDQGTNQQQGHRGQRP